MSEVVSKPRGQGATSMVATNLSVAEAFDAGWTAHRDGIHWKRCGLTGDHAHAWQGGWASREAAGRSGVLP